MKKQLNHFSSFFTVIVALICFIPVAEASPVLDSYMSIKEKQTILITVEGKYRDRFSDKNNIANIITSANGDIRGNLCIRKTEVIFDNSKREDIQSNIIAVIKIELTVYGLKNADAIKEILLSCEGITTAEYDSWFSVDTNGNNTNDKPENEFPANKKGDVDLDGILTPADARLVLRFSVGLEAPQNIAIRETADFDNDGNITSADAREILRSAVGL